MCMLYQGRVSYMESNSVIGLMGGIDGPGITWNVTHVDLSSKKNLNVTLGEGLDAVEGFGFVKPESEEPLLEKESLSVLTAPTKIAEQLPIA